MKKILIPLVGIVALILVGGGIWIKVKGQSSDPKKEIIPTPTIEEGKILEFSLTNPLVLAYPSREGHELTLQMSKLNNINKVHYEVIYQTKDKEEGSLGDAILKPGETSIERKLLFGTCSTGGKCVFNEGVESGSIEIKFYGKDNTVSEWKSNFRMQSTVEKKLMSMDEKISLEQSGKSNNYVITTPLSSLPAPIESKTVVGQPYGFFPLVPLTQKNMKLSIKVENPDQAMKIFGWDSDNLTWIDYKGEVNTTNSSIDTLVDRLMIFVVAK